MINKLIAPATLKVAVLDYIIYDVKFTSAHRRALDEGSGGQYLAHGYLGGDVTLSWHLPLLPQPFPSFARYGTQTANLSASQTTSASPSIFGRSVSSEKSRTASSGQRGGSKVTPRRVPGRVRTVKAEHGADHRE